MDVLPPVLISPAMVSPTKALSRLVGALRERAYNFVAVTPATHLLINARDENAGSSGARDVFGWNRPFAARALDPELFAIAEAAGILRRSIEHGGAAWRSLVRAATLDGHIFLHSGFPTLAADAVFFGPDTYRFAACVTRHLRAGGGCIRRAVDIGCGSGAAGILISLARPRAQVILADINRTALSAAACNATAAGASNTKCLHSDLFREIDGVFDLIVANPPFLNDSAQRQYRHGGGALGAELSLRILDEALPRLTQGGTLLLYTGSAIVAGDDLLAHAAAARLAGSGLAWDYREIDPDIFGEELATRAYEGVDRIAAVLLTVTRS